MCRQEWNYNLFPLRYRVYKKSIGKWVILVSLHGKTKNSLGFYFFIPLISESFDFTLQWINVFLAFPLERNLLYLEMATRILTKVGFLAHRKKRSHTGYIELWIERTWTDHCDVWTIHKFHHDTVWSCIVLENIRHRTVGWETHNP